MRILNISNRLPVTVSETADGFTYKESMGGLVTGLQTYMEKKKKESADSEFLWIGWPGSTIAETNREKLKKELTEKYRNFPVFLSLDAMDKFYHGFCNKTIWPLFHYFPTYTIYEEDLWLEYRDVNQIFADAVMEVYQPGDIIWIHDYHLMLLPKILREKLPNVKIGFFLHIPFPTFEIYRLLPARWRAQILTGLLGSDLIGFHTHDYTQYFMNSISRILGLEHNFQNIHFDERNVIATTFPMGIEYDKFSNQASDPEILKSGELIKKSYQNKKIVLSIDRLDYSKGIAKRLRGYERFLARNPEWHSKVVLIVIVVPSRVEVDQYQEMKRDIDELVGHINGKYGTMDWTPINYQYKYLPHNELISLYRASDVALVTPLRDGMNLIAKEYVSSRTDNHGVLIISEMAGASKEMGEAIVINPNNRTEIAGALKTALEMPVDEMERRNRRLHHRLKRYTVVRWAEDFLNQLAEAGKDDIASHINLMEDEDYNHLVSDFCNARERAVFLDYDGTLVPFVSNPEDARPGQDLLRLLKSLTEVPNTDVTIISGRNTEFLERWLGELPVNIVAEHGAWIRYKGKTGGLIKPITTGWKDSLRPIMERYVDLLPGSFIEEKNYSMVWHYRMADIEHVAIKKKELIDDLVNFSANEDLQVLQGNKVVEVRNSGITKGYAILDILSRKKYDFILAAGDDVTDEDIFNVMNQKDYSIKVGLTPTRARFTVKHLENIHEILQSLVQNGK